MPRKRGIGGNRPDRLSWFVSTFEGLEERKRELAREVTDTKKQAQLAGFDTRVITQMLRERRMSDEARDEWQALCETYRAALGMLHGTPLGEAARQRLMGEQPPAAPGEANAAPDGQDGEADAETAAVTAHGPEQIEAARAAGAAAFRAKVKVTANPHGFADPCRAAWDEGWCKEAGSDGMDLPDAWRRSKPAKGNGKGDEPGDGKGGPG